MSLEVDLLHQGFTRISFDSDNFCISISSDMQTGAINFIDLKESEFALGQRSWSLVPHLLDDLGEQIAMEGSI